MRLMLHYLGIHSLFTKIHNIIFQCGLLCRVEERLKQLEKKGQVATRWKLCSPQFLSAIKVVENEKREIFLQHLHSLSVERHLQLMLKFKYSRMLFQFSILSIMSFLTILLLRFI